MNRSPYTTDIVSLQKRFSTSNERTQILNGFLRYRKQLHSLGLTTGFQWIDGSFVEDVERTKERPPNDIDVVTFVNMPVDFSQAALANAHPELFNPVATKSQYSVDAYYLFLGEPIDASHIKRISYWYSMWSHQRDGQWKGFLQIDLAPVDSEDDFETLTPKAGGAS